MAAFAPHINVIRDTPTSPNHAPVNVFTSPATTPGADAPEVNHDAEGLQVDPHGLYPKPTTDGEGTARWWIVGGSSEKQARIDDDDGLIPAEERARRREERKMCGVKRRTFFIILTVAAIAIIAAGVGGGVGGYYATKSKPTSTSDSSPTPTSPAVTSGTVGMASLPCTSSASSPHWTPVPQTPYLTTGATFNITCARGLPPIPDRNGVRFKDVERWVDYNITSCMDRCAANAECAGILYGANLTDMVADGDPGVNCVLKNTTWDPEAGTQKSTWFASAIKV